MTPIHNSEQEFLNQIQFCSFLSTGKIQDIHKKFQTYQQIVQKFNNKFNLISQNDLNKIWIRHFFDSVIPIKLFTQEFSIMHNSPPPHKRLRGIDIGTGAGFPGLPVALLCTGISLTLVDSIQKKYRFLKNILIPALLSREELIPPYQMDSLAVLCARAEKLAHQKEHREQYDFAFARALAKPLVALELLLPFVKVGGKAFFWASGKEWSEEKKIEKRAHHLGAKLYDKKEYLLPGENRKRALLVMQKISETDTRFPLAPHILKREKTLAGKEREIFFIEKSFTNGT